MYCNDLGMVHLIWALLSFVFSTQATFFISCIFMLPLYTYEFVMTYGNRIEMVAASHTFQKYGFYFTWELEHPTLELLLYFIIMTIFWMMLGCMFLVYEARQDDYILS